MEGAASDFCLSYISPLIAAVVGDSFPMEQFINWIVCVCVCVCVLEGACSSFWPYFVSALVSGTLRCRNAHLGIGFILELLKQGHLPITEFHWQLSSFHQHGNAPCLSLFGQWRCIFQWNSLRWWVLQGHSEAVLAIDSRWLHQQECSLDLMVFVSFSKGKSMKWFFFF